MGIYTCLSYKALELHPFAQQDLPRTRRLVRLRSGSSIQQRIPPSTSDDSTLHSLRLFLASGSQLLRFLSCWLGLSEFMLKARRPNTMGQRLWIAFLFISLCPILTVGQSLTTGSLVGTVTDPSGAAVTKASDRFSQRDEANHRHKCYWHL